MAAENTHIAHYLEQHKDEILNRWRAAAQEEQEQAHRLSKMDDRELLDHLPALTEALIGVLRGEEASLVEDDARRHGHQRRLDGYKVVDVLWELTIFRRVFLAVLDEASEEVADWIPVDGSRTILNLLDVCARASIDQLVKETEQERDAAAARARLLEVQRQRFLGTLSHELRNQIQPILFALELIKASELTEQQLRAVEMIDRQTRQQSFLIEDLLDLYRREIGKIELSRSLVDLRECVQHAAETNQAQVDLKSLHVQLELPANPVYALVDRGRLCQVANNLMSNAVKFTPENGTIVWRLYAEPGWQVMSIRDSGIGIKAGDLLHVFDIFFQGEVPTTIRQGGLGIGLPVVKNLIELHGATIEARSDGEGAGAEFIVRIPAPDP
ncbi:MAG: HAMP domain-containing histidine kinase [Deltaproteobacteria bacterium]|nr:HAMP domain-containing histidine kinase [Deltaproteobacteria bacterium]